MKVYQKWGGHVQRGTTQIVWAESLQGLCQHYRDVKKKFLYPSQISSSTTPDTQRIVSRGTTLSCDVYDTAFTKLDLQNLA
jgi:hypothetical protein